MTDLTPSAESGLRAEAVTDPDTGIVYFPDDDTPNPCATADKDAPFRWDWLIDEGGLPVHLPIGVTAEGRGPTQDSEAHHYLCWCSNPKCLLSYALRLAWESGTRATPPAEDQS